MADHFDQNAYLTRLGVTAPPSVDAAGLQQLAAAQLTTLPFENFDIHLGRGIDVDPTAIFDKLVRHRRGGYCFELNGLFLQALRAFGFEARALLARVHVSGEPSGRTHQLSLVSIDGGHWLVDVGFGAQCPRQPMRFAHDQETEHGNVRFRLVDAPPWGTMLQTFAERADVPGWTDLYSFDTTVVCQADIETGNHFTSTSPKSFFSIMRLVVLPSATGRAVLANYDLTLVDDGRVEQRRVAGGDAYLRVLDDHFGIDLQASYDQLKALPEDS